MILLSRTVTVAVIVVKCSVTSVWGYELLRIDCSIRVSDCSIRVSRSENYFYANCALKLHQNSGPIIIPTVIQAIIPAPLLLSICASSICTDCVMLNVYIRMCLYIYYSEWNYIPSGAHKHCKTVLQTYACACPACMQQKNTTA